MLHLEALLRANAGTTTTASDTPIVPMKQPRQGEPARTTK
jgi:hypothetical protein